MARWLDQLHNELRRRGQAGLLRSLHAVDRCDRIVRRDGRTLVNLASNDYLALAGDRRLAHAVAQAAERYGVGAGASRLVSGDLEIHRRVERQFAQFKSAEAALLLPTGYAANFAVLTALAGEHDAVFIDKLNHASLIDGARASGATVRAFPHRNYDKLAHLLERHRGARRRLIVTDSVFSMDGDCADLAALCELRDAHDAILIVDEAHGTGVLGATGAGLAEHQGVAGRIDVTVSTAGKALGCLGGVVTAPAVVIDTLVNSARQFIYCTAMPPTQAAAIEAALAIVRDEPTRRTRLADLSRRLRRLLADRGWPVRSDPTPIVPIIVGDPAEAVRLADRLDAAGFLAPAIRPPTVAPGSSRIRVCLRADLEDGDIDRFVEALGPPPGVAPAAD